MQIDAPKGHVEMLLLAVLHGGPAHGYGIVERLRRDSDGVLDFPEGTVYPALYRLERAGLVRSSWAVVERRRRRVYRLTRRGLGELEHRRTGWRRLARAMEVVLS